MDKFMQGVEYVHQAATELLDMDPDNAPQEQLSVALLEDDIAYDPIVAASRQEASRVLRATNAILLLHRKSGPHQPLAVANFLYKIEMAMHQEHFNAASLKKYFNQTEQDVLKEIYHWDLDNKKEREARSASSKHSLLCKTGIGAMAIGSAAWAWGISNGAAVEKDKVEVVRKMTAVAQELEVDPPKGFPDLYSEAAYQHTKRQRYFQDEMEKKGDELHAIERSLNISNVAQRAGLLLQKLGAGVFTVGLLAAAVNMANNKTKKTMQQINAMPAFSALDEVIETVCQNERLDRERLAIQR